MHLMLNLNALTLILSLSLSLSAAPNFPFPHNATYAHGIKPSNIDNSKVQAAYDDFMSRFYEESGDLARIKWDNPSQTVSEGIGYGMLIMVYMDNSSNNTQAKFDKLWNYYNSFLNGNGLMNWKIDGFSGVASQNAATDAELDAAVALVQAHKQWGDQKYLNDASTLIGKIYQHEVNDNGYLKPGDAWDSKKNPSYLSTAALESFKNAGSQDWDRVISTSYTLLNASRNSTTGLVPDWCEENGSPLAAYSYDAARTPWRIAWDYVWYGRSDAKNFCTKIASWINSNTGGNASDIVDGYALDGGKTGQWNNSTFVGPFACAGMVDASHQTWLNNANDRMNTLVGQDETYFSHCLKLITLLLLSGNMPDLWANSNTIEKYTLNLTSDPINGGTIQTNSSETEFESGSQITIQAQPANDYQFLYWSGDVSGTEISKTFTITKDMSITAHFEPSIKVHHGRVNSHSHSLFADDYSIYYSVPVGGNVRIQIFDVTGKMISEPVSNYFPGGVSSVKLPLQLNRGLFLVQMTSIKGQLTQRLFITK